jgi:hypothetical protein
MKQRVAQAFAERVKQRNLGPDVQVIYRVVGGMPSQRVKYEVAVDSVGGARVAGSDARVTPTARHASIPPERVDVVDLFEQISAGLHSLMPEGRATFLPDALVGSLTISIDGDEETFYFVPEKEIRRTASKAVAPAIDRALQRLWIIAKDTTDGQKDTKYE